MWRCETCGSNLLDDIPECPVCMLPAESAAALNTDKIVAQTHPAWCSLMITAGVLFFLSWPVLYLCLSLFWMESQAVWSIFLDRFRLSQCCCSLPALC